MEMLIAKYNSSGVIQWQRYLGGSNRDEGQGIAVDSSGNVYVVGTIISSGGDFIIAKYNTSGSSSMARSLGGSGDHRGFDIAVDSSGNVYVTGYHNGSSGIVGSPNIITQG